MTDETFLFCDTETSGFPRSGAKVQDGQARVCQLALILTDHTGKPLSKFCSLIKPDGWKISEGANKVHGITDEACEKYGIGFISAVGLFYYLAGKATTIVAHNVKFDSELLGIETSYAERSGEKFGKLPDWFCTMGSNTHIMNGKWPKLSETYKHYMQRDLVDAHDALADAEACKDIFFAMKKANGW